MAISIPIINVPNSHPNIAIYPQILLAQKENIEAGSLLFLNKEEDEKAKIQEAELKVRQAKADAIDNYFKKHDMPLAGMGMKMVEEAERYGLNWRLLPSIAVVESTGGKFACKRVTHSFLGWGSCKINFKSKDKAIEIVAWNLGGKNSTTDEYYANKNTKQILENYNPPEVAPGYANKVMKVMNAIGSEDLTIDPIHSSRG